MSKNRCTRRGTGAWGYYVTDELKRFPDEESRKAAVKQVNREVALSWLYLGTLIVLAIPLVELSGAITRALAPFMPAIVPGFQRLLSYLFYGLLMGGAVYGYFWLRRHRARRILRAHLIKRGVPICLHCGYDLRGQTDPRCPECGRPFDPTLLRPAAQPTNSDHAR